MRQIKFGNAPHSCFDHFLMNPREYFALIDLCRGKKVIEIGSFRGGSAELLAPRVKSLICIDPHDDIEWDDGAEEGKKVITYGKDVQAEFLECTRQFKNITYYKMTSDDAKYIFYPHCRTEISIRRAVMLALMTEIPRRIDIVVIDGDHSANQCLKDIQNYVQVAKKYVIVHDYCTMFGSVISACMCYFKRLPDQLIDTLAIYKIRKDDIHA